ncbi:MAG: PD-(D/E)XK nuclease-like domain-containing protein, partial [Geminicoccaceae bacterium]
MNNLITKPGVHDIPASRYHEDPCPEPSLSNSIAKMILNDSPLHAAAHHPRLATEQIKIEKDIFDLGTAAHTLLLREGKKFEIVKAKDWRAKAAQKAKKEARANGLIPILEHQFDRTVEMVEMCRQQLKAHEVGDLLADGIGEQTLVWQEGDVWCRSLLDWMPPKIEEGCTFV